MSYAAIMAHVQADAGAEGRLACARALADRFEATLIGIGAEMIPPYAFDSGYATVQADWITAMRGVCEDNLKAARKAFDAAAKGLAKPAIWECGVQLPAPAVARASRGADLIVASNPVGRGADPYRDAAPGDLAISSGRPVLVVPAKAQPLTAKRVMVAWKDTREARRSLADALPFLKRADAVLVVEVCHEDDKGDATIRTGDVADALARHGVRAEAKVDTHRDADGHEILRQASLFGADLIVAGAYGHSRLGEWVFGGVSRDLLVQNDRYVLLSH